LRLPPYRLPPLRALFGSAPYLLRGCFL
jgi:hypothetical protein